MWKEFRDFILKGNVLELAVAVIVAGAFGAVISSLTNDVIMPPIGLALGGVDFSDLAITLQPAQVNDVGEVLQDAVLIKYGAFLQKIIDFLIIAFIIFMLLRTYKKMTAKQEAAAPPPPPPGPTQEELLMQIRDLLKK